MSDATKPQDTGLRPRWTRLAALGLVLAGLGPLLLFAAAALWGLSVSEDAPFFLTTAAAAFIGAFLVLRFGTWGKVVGAIAAFLVAGALFWTAFGLQAPASFFDFVPGLVVIPGGLLALVCCIGAIVAQRRGRLTASAEGGERTGIRIALGVLAVGVLVSGGLTLLGRSSVGEAAANEVALTVDLSDFEFDQSEYEVEGGTTVLVRNSDPFFHTFTVDELGIDEALSPGSEKIIEIPVDAGDYVLYCRPHTFEPKDPTEDDMAATLRVI